MLSNLSRLSDFPQAVRGLSFVLAFASLIIAAERASAACVSALSGRMLDPASIRPFGKIQGLPPLPLERNEYVLSIDDGPMPATTPALLATLRERCIKATFFFIGNRASAHPELVGEARTEGHTVGSHSFRHPDFGKLDEAGRTAEMDKGVQAVASALKKSRKSGVGGQTLAYVRFPGALGSNPNVPASLADTMRAKGEIVAGYDISPEDWRNSPPQESFARFLKRMGDRGVIVLHDAQPNTLKLLPIILDELERRHAKVVALP